MLTLKVPQASCGHCAAAIEKAVKSIDQAAKVQVDLGEKTVKVQSAADETAVRRAIEAAGYANDKIVQEAFNGA